MLTTHQVQISLTAAGNVDDYDANVRESLAQRFAELSQVDAEDVTISIEPASVRILASIQVEDASSGVALKSSLASQLSSVAASSTLLAISVESTPSLTITSSRTPSMSPPPASSSPSPPALQTTTEQLAVETADKSNEGPTTLIIAASSAGAALAALALVCAVLRHKQMTRKKASEVDARSTSVVVSHPELELNSESATAAAQAGIETYATITMPAEYQSEDDEQAQVADLERQLAMLRRKIPASPSRHEDSAKQVAEKIAASVSTPQQQSATYLISIDSGPIGMGLKEIKGAAVVIVSSINDESAAIAQGAQVNSVVLAVNGESTYDSDKAGVLAKIESAQTSGQTLTVLLSEPLGKDQIMQLQELATQPSVSEEDFAEMKRALVPEPELKVEFV